MTAAVIALIVSGTILGGSILYCAVRVISQAIAGDHYAREVVLAFSFVAVVLTFVVSLAEVTSR